MREAPDPSLKHCPQTILELFDEASTYTIDLRRPVGSDEAATLQRLGLLPRFAVLTAGNPLGHQLDPVENDSRRRNLLETLIQKGLYFVPANGVSPDRLHCEEGFGVRCSKTHAVAFARRFQQTAFFWFDGSSFHIVGGMARLAPIVLPARLMNRAP
jgi:hypothetical protein